MQRSGRRSCPTVRGVGSVLGGVYDPRGRARGSGSVYDPRGRVRGGVGPCARTGAPSPRSSGRGFMECALGVLRTRSDPTARPVRHRTTRDGVSGGPVPSGPVGSACRLGRERSGPRSEKWPIEAPLGGPSLASRRHAYDSDRSRARRPQAVAAQTARTAAPRTDVSRPTVQRGAPSGPRCSR